MELTSNQVLHLALDFAHLKVMRTSCQRRIDYPLWTFSHFFSRHVSNFSATSAACARRIYLGKVKARMKYLNIRLKFSIMYSILGNYVGLVSWGNAADILSSRSSLSLNLALILHEYFVTFEYEVTIGWQRKFNLTSSIFMLNRWMSLGILFIQFILSSALLPVAMTVKVACLLPRFGLIHWTSLIFSKVYASVLSSLLPQCDGTYGPFVMYLDAIRPQSSSRF